jgi:hypothetical protein
MRNQDQRFIDLSSLTTSELLDLGDYIAFVECPYCIEGWIPDPEGIPEQREVLPGLVVIDITPVPCEDCGGEGMIVWISPN